MANLDYKAPEGWRRLLIGLNLSVCGYEAFFFMVHPTKTTHLPDEPNIF